MGKISAQIPNMISLSRGITAAGILFTPVFSPAFWILYGWCGISDMIDGPLARKMGATSKAGATIDSITDLMFFVAAAFKILPILKLPTWLWCCIGAFAVAQIINMSYCYFKLGGFSALHNRINRLLGLLLFLLPILLQILL